MFAYAKFKYNTLFLPLLSDISIPFSIITFGLVQSRLICINVYKVNCLYVYIQRPPTMFAFLCIHNLYLPKYNWWFDTLKHSTFLNYYLGLVILHSWSVCFCLMHYDKINTQVLKSGHRIRISWILEAHISTIVITVRVLEGFLHLFNFKGIIILL